MRLFENIHIKLFILLLSFDIYCFSASIKDSVINAYINLSLELNKDVVGNDSKKKDCSIKEIKFPNFFYYKVIDGLEKIDKKNYCEIFNNFENSKAIVYDSTGKYKRIDTSLIKIEIKNNNYVSSDFDNKCLFVIYEMYYNKLFNKGFYFAFGNNWIVKSFERNKEKEWKIIDTEICGWLD